MILQRTNIEDKLRRLRSKQLTELEILAQVRDILAMDKEQEKSVDSINLPKNSINTFDFDLLETNRIFHLDQIKRTCIDYRLRFLDIRYFKGEIPHTATTRIKALESQHNTELQGLKIMAPSKLFKLHDKDDPLLFAPMGNDYFYLVHKWGKDLHPLRKLLVWPFKNMANLAFFSLGLSFLTALLIPDGLFSKNNSAAEFWIIFFFMFKWIAAVFIFYGFALGKNFNPAIWNSKYFNA